MPVKFMVTTWRPSGRITSTVQMITIKMLKSAIDIIVGIVLGVFLGYIVDHVFHTTPFMTIILGACGYLVVLYKLYKTSKGKDE